VSVCPSVRPSLADIDSKLMIVGSRSFHQRVALSVAQRPRDASCLSVVSFNSTIP